MKKVKSLQLALLLIASNLLALGEMQAQQIRVFSSAQGSGKNAASYEFDKWNFSVGRNQYEIRKDGKGKREIGKTSISNFSVELENGEFITRVFFAGYKGDLLLLFETDEGGNGGGVIFRFHSDTLKPKWKAYIPDFNIGKGLIEENFTYLTARAFIAKLDLESGKFIWKHERDFGFHYFETPALKGDTVIFREGVESGTRLVEVNKVSGKIIKVTAL